jgi:hypothetical protein
MRLDPEKVLRLVNAIDPRINKDAVSLDYAAYRELKEYATEALHFEIANRKGGKREETRRRTALAYLKKSGTAPYSGHCWIENGWQIFTDNRSAYRFAEGHYIEGLPQISPEEWRVPNTAPFFKQVADTTSEVQVNKKDLEITVATWRAAGRPDENPYSVGTEYYSAEALLDALKLLGVDEATVRQREPELSVNPYYREGDEHRKAYTYHPGHIVLEGREAVIMPLDKLKVKKNKEESQ